MILICYYAHCCVWNIYLLHVTNTICLKTWQHLLDDYRDRIQSRHCTLCIHNNLQQFFTVQSTKTNICSTNLRKAYTFQDLDPLYKSFHRTFYSIQYSVSCAERAVIITVSDGIATRHGLEAKPPAKCRLAHIVKQTGHESEAQQQSTPQFRAYIINDHSILQVLHTYQNVTGKRCSIHTEMRYVLLLQP